MKTTRPVQPIVSYGERPARLISRSPMGLSRWWRRGLCLGAICFCMPTIIVNGSVLLQEVHWVEPKVQTTRTAVNPGPTSKPIHRFSWNRHRTEQWVRDWRLPGSETISGQLEDLTERWLDPTKQPQVPVRSPAKQPPSQNAP